MAGVEDQDWVEVLVRWYPGHTTVVLMVGPEREEIDEDYPVSDWQSVRPKVENRLMRAGLSPSPVHRKWELCARGPDWEEFRRTFSRNPQRFT